MMSDTIIIILTASALLCLILVYSIYGNYNKDNVLDFNYSLDKRISMCNNNSIENNINCINQYLENHFKYVRINDNITLSNEDLLKFGGDCNNWAMLWEYISEKLNYDSKSIMLNVTETDKYYYVHKFIIISNDFGYCKVDQIYINCLMYNFTEELIKIN